MIKKSKSLGAMSPVELVEEARISPQEASRIGQYLYSIGNNPRAWQAWMGLSPDESLTSNPDLSTFMLRALESNGPSKTTYGILANFLNGTGQISDSRVVSTMKSLAFKYPQSDFPPMMMLLKKTPATIIHLLASHYGMQPKYDFKQGELRNLMLNKMILLSSSYPWRNEDSGIIVGQMIPTDKTTDPMIIELMDESIRFPSTFVHAVLENGNNEMVDAIFPSFGRDTSIEEACLFYDRGDDKRKDIVTNAIANNSGISSRDKAMFFRHVGKEANDSESQERYSNIIKGHIYPSTDPDIFVIGIEDMEKGRPFDLYKMTDNLEMSLHFADRIMYTAKKLKVEDHINPAIRHFFALTGEDDEF